MSRATHKKSEFKLFSFIFEREEMKEGLEWGQNRKTTENTQELHKKVQGMERKVIGIFDIIDLVMGR